MKLVTSSGTVLKIGDKVNVNMTLRHSKIDQYVEGWVTDIPTYKSGEIGVKLDSAGGTVHIYPRVEDLQGVSVQETPENWPPKADDVWKDGTEHWHYLEGKLVSSTGMSSYPKLADFLLSHPNAVLAFRAGR